MTALPLNYYAQFRDASGNLLTGTDGQTWFAVSDVSVNTEATLNINGSGTTTTFNPLYFKLGTDTVDTALLTAEAGGTAFTQIEVAGYSGTGSNAVLVTDDVFKDAAISDLVSGNSGTSVEMQYADTVKRFYPTASAGQSSTPTVAGYDRLTKTADTSTNTATGAAGYPVEAPLSGSPATTDTTAPLTFYVQFRDTLGNVLTNGSGQTWFAISNLSVPSTQTLSGSDTGTGSGIITFDPVGFTIDGAALPLLLTMQTSGAALGAVEIAGYSGTGATATLAEDFLDRSAEVQTLSTGPDGSQTVGLATRDLVQSVYPTVLSGGLGLPVPVTGGWNRTTNSADTSTDTHASLLGTPDAVPATPLTYYVQFRDNTGALLTGDNGQVWFAASDVGFGSEQAYSTAGSPTGASFDPLTVTLTPDSILTKLFASQASGIVLQQIEVAGYNARGTLVTDDAFKRAIATADTTNADGSASVSFGYEAFTQNTYSTGKLDHAITSTQGYNLLTRSVDTGTNTAGGTPGNALDAPTGSVPPTTPAAGTLTYYAQIRLKSGALLTGTGGKTWFAVSDLGFQSAQTLSGANTGRVSFGALSFTLGADAVLPTLLQDTAAATVFQSVELAGYSGMDAGDTLVADDLFKLAVVATDTAHSDGTDTLSLQFGGLLQTAYAPDASGTPVQVAAAGWNIVTNSADNTTKPIGGGTTYPLAAPVTGAPPTVSSPGPLTYYVQFRNASGSYVTTAAGSTWFAISGYSQQTVQAVTLDSQSSGSSSGKVDFNPASFTFDDPLLQPLLFQESCQGTPYQSVEIAGYAGSGNSATLVQDDILKEAVVASVGSGSDNSTAITLAYADLVQRSYVQAPTGMTALSSIGGWNAITNTKDTTSAALSSSGSASNADGAIPVAPLAGTPASVTSAAPLTYYIEFRPTSGTTLQDSTGATFIPVSGVSFTTVQELTIGSQSTIAGTGKVTFAPLTFTIAPNSVSSTLFKDLTAGTSIDAAFLVGYDTHGITPFQTFSDEFRVVTVGMVTTNSDGSETVSVDYSGLQEIAGVRTGNITVGTPPQGWDKVRNTSATYADASGAPTDSLPDAGPACYCPGTRIATPGGDAAVEDLAAGDLVLTADGRALPVVWIGRRSYHGRFVAGRRDILPVTITAGALADGVPSRALTVSPEHAMLIDGLLVPARSLVNGTTIVQATRVDTVHYLHVELERHEAILANGAASESFVDDNSRNAFHNAHEWRGPAQCGPAEYCAPRIESGYELETIRRRIARRQTSQAA